jgi:CDP-diglyceride synthetase
VASVLWKRVLSAAVLIPAVVWVVAGAPPWVFGSLAVALSAAAAWEFCRLFQRAGRVVRPGLAALCCAVVTASFVVPGGPVAALAATTAVMLASLLGGAGAPTSDGMAIGVVSLCYVGVSMGHAVLLSSRRTVGPCCSFLAVAVGRRDGLRGGLAGRPPQAAPRISPGKPSRARGPAGRLDGGGLALAGWCRAGRAWNRGWPD